MNDYKIIGYDEETIKSLVEVSKALDEFQTIRNAYLAELEQLRIKYQTLLLSHVDTIGQLMDLK